MNRSYENHCRNSKTIGQVLVIGIGCFITLAGGMALLVNILGNLAVSFNFRSMLCFTFLGICSVFILVEFVGFTIAYMLDIK